MPNTSSMRLATYHVPAAKGDADETDVSVVRAGGTTDANIDRWVRQFDEAGAPARKGWSLLGAVVETSSSPYFFKMTGPTASVKAARGAFMALLDGLTPP